MQLYNVAALIRHTRALKNYHFFWANAKLSQNVEFFDSKMSVCVFIE